MEFLRFLESIRTPLGNAFFSAVTHLGEETFFIVVGLLYLWCINKKQGYYILSVGFWGIMLNRFLKLIFRVPRPWVRDPNFTIVESARAEATGYSFPSGHTQCAVGVFGCIAYISRHLWVRILCIAACILVPLSRMYLGVHTPADVLTSLIIGVILIFLLYPIINKALETRKTARIYLAVMTAFSLLLLIYILVYPFPADIDPANLESGLKNAYKMLGCILGLWISYEMDESCIHFDTKAVWWAQLLKLGLGLLIVLALKTGLKTPLYALCGGNYLADGIRYFLMVIFAGCLWPLIFKYFPKPENAPKK